MTTENNEEVYDGADELAEESAKADEEFLSALEDDDSTDTPEEPPSAGSATETDDSEAASGGVVTGEDEPPNPLAKETTEVAPEFERNFMLLSKQQNALRQEQQRLKEERDALIEQGRKEAFAKLREDPWGVLGEQGWDADALVERAAGTTDPTSVQLREVKAELAAIKAEREAAKKAQEEAQTAAAQEAEIASYVSAIPQHLSKHTEKFKYLTSLYDASTQGDLVFQVQNAVYNDPKDGRALSIEQAASLLEAELTKHHGTSKPDDSTDADNNSADNKAKPPVQSSKGTAPRKTLTNNLTVSTQNTDELSDEENDKLAEEMLLRALAAE